MKKQFLFMMLLCIFGIQLSAQLSTDRLDYSKYVPVEQRYRTLGFNASSSGQFDDHAYYLKYNTRLGLATNSW